jgi:signal transduction histidine kinase
VPEATWVIFAAANLLAMEAMVHAGPGFRDWQTVPFHFIYVSFTLLYGFRAWRTGRTLLGLLFVVGSTGVITMTAVLGNREDAAEMTEVPLMALMFGAMVYHVMRRQEATALAEALAVDRQQMLDREHAFISDSSHELLTPLTIMRGHVELLDREPDAGADVVAERCDIVLAELDRVEHLVDGLLLLQSALSPDFLRLEHISAGDLVGSLFRRWSGTAARQWVLGPLAQGTVPADAGQLTAALDAVLENAVVHTDQGGTIKMSSARRDGSLVVWIRDDGDGIAPEALPRIFDRFYRGDGARNRRAGGAGLGLSVARAIVRAHGGDIEAASSPGSGTTFEIRLPGLQSEAVAGAADRLDLDRRRQLSPQPADVDVHNI